MRRTLHHRKVKQILLLSIIFGLFAVPCFAQKLSEFIALESTREEVEKILGKPDKYFATYGSYETGMGKFSVWYSTGKCRKDVEGRQYKVKANLMTALLVYLKYGPLVKSTIPDISNYTRQKSPNFDRYLYLSKDESTTYETIVYGNSTERVYSESIEPSKDKRHLLCKNSR